MSIEEQAHGWLRRADALLRAVQSAAELSAAQRDHFDGFLAVVATLLGLFVVRRLQELPPYYIGSTAALGWRQKQNGRLKPPTGRLNQAAGWLAGYLG